MLLVLQIVSRTFVNCILQTAWRKHDKINHKVSICLVCNIQYASIWLLLMNGIFFVLMNSYQTCSED